MTFVALNYIMFFVRKGGMDTYVYRYEGKLYVNLTNRCCNACSFCLRNNGDGVGDDNLWLQREGSVEEIKELIKKEPDDELIFCGYGESTYRLDAMLSLAEFAKSLGKKIRLNTNGLGSLINGKDIVPLLKGKVDVVSVSLNQKDAPSYDKISRSMYGEAAFSAMLEFARECVAAGIKTIMTVVDVIPPEDIKECEKIAAALGCEFRVREYIS